MSTPERGVPPGSSPGSASSAALLLVDVGEPAAAAVVAVEVGGHEDAVPTVLRGALLLLALDLARAVHGVVLEHPELDGLGGALDLLGLGVGLLLALLPATAQAQHQVERGLLLDVVVGQGAAILQLLAGEDQTLLIRT